MKRREFMSLLGGAAAWPLTARAQQSEGIRRIGVLLPFAENDPDTRADLAVFGAEISQRGWIEGRNLQIDYRWGAGQIDSAKELVELNPAVIVGRSTPVTAALQSATRSIPIVFLVVSDPVGDGLVTSIARPGGNITGFTNVEASLGGKWLELLKEIAPGTERIAVLFDPKTSPGGGTYYLRLVEGAAAIVAKKIDAIPIQDAAAIEPAIAAFGRESNGGLLVLPDVTTNAHRSVIIAAAARWRLPAVYAYRYITAEGGLASYGVDVTDLYRRAAGYVDRILRGEKPAELPVQAPVKFEFVINLKTARTLGINVSPILLARADEVIDEAAHAYVRTSPSLSCRRFRSG
jgi:putative ABC transport system substrate-binding protein